VIIYDYLRYAAQALASLRKKSGSVQDVLLYIQKLLPLAGKRGATWIIFFHLILFSIEKPPKKRKIGYPDLSFKRYIRAIFGKTENL
jgi:hypothetical protein